MVNYLGFRSIYIFTAKLSLHADEDEEEEGAGKGPKKEKRVVTPVAEFI